jgi:hypothetical protein
MVRVLGVSEIGLGHALRLRVSIFDFHGFPGSRLSDKHGLNLNYCFD